MASSEDELIGAVKEMRKAQREYFKTRSDDSLTWSKRLEKYVDKLLVDHTDGQKKIPGM